MEEPLISVIIPVYNAQLFLEEAIQSVVRQTYKNLQIIITDDGSTDNSVAIAKQFVDDRIEIYVSSVNLGQAHQLNLGISKATGSFICIMHADDIMLKDKLEKQYRFLVTNPEVGICGCNLKLIGSQTGEIKYPEYDQQCKDMMLSAPPFAHSAVLARREIFNGLSPVYHQHLVPAEDYDLWVRLASQTRFANIQEALLQYRIHPEQIGTLKKHKEQTVLAEIRKKLLAQTFQLGSENEVEKCFNSIYAAATTNCEDIFYSIQLLWIKHQQMQHFSTSMLRGRLKHILYITLQRLPLNKRLSVLFSSAALLQIVFLKTLFKVVFASGVRQNSASFK